MQRDPRPAPCCQPFIGRYPNTDAYGRDICRPKFISVTVININSSNAFAFRDAMASRLTHGDSPGTGLRGAALRERRRSAARRLPLRRPRQGRADARTGAALGRGGQAKTGADTRRKEFASQGRHFRAWQFARRRTGDATARRGMSAHPRSGRAALARAQIGKTWKRTSRHAGTDRADMVLADRAWQARSGPSGNGRLVSRNRA
jgi:hypothetical protein